MNLFELAAGAAEAEAQPLGFRLERLEVYNWGTFDSKVWSLELDGETALLTGDVGSGKSTLVDAVITLLVPPKKVTYNKAADASAKERSLTSYVRGYYGQSRTEDGGGRPEALRGRDSYSVLVGVFRDRNFGRTVSLAQVFWFPDEVSHSPSHFYIKAERTLSIVRDFSAIGTDMRAFRRRLEQDTQIRTFDDYPPYAQEFRKIFGIRQAQAMDLFQQTVSMKKVDSLTTFVRQNMLEAPDIEQEIALLLSQYHDLEQAHQAVVRAQQQVEALTPIEQLAADYRAAEQELQQCAAMQRLLPAWLAEQDYAYQKQKLAVLQKQVRQKQAKAEELQQQLQQQRARQQELLVAMAQNGGDRLATKQQELTHLRAQQAQVAQARQNYATQAAVLDLPVPESAAAFADNAARLAERAVALTTQAAELENDKLTYKQNVQEQTQRMQELTQEIASLAQRKSNIPRKFVDLRDRLCAELGLAEQEMPFAGELMAVQEEEQAWEGALERLLHGFGLSLLVPEVHYPEVVRWLEEHRLGLRLVYFCVSDTALAEAVAMPEDTACSKLRLKEEAPLTGWLAAELRQRFQHVCCEDVKTFRQQRFALSPQGQIKTNGRRHEKDDRYDINDRHHYVLGFSNLQKIQMLKDELAAAQDEKDFFAKQVRAGASAQKRVQAQQWAVKALQGITQYTAIDVKAQAEAVADCEALVKMLTQQNDVYQHFAAEAKEAAKLAARLDAACGAAQSDYTQVQQDYQSTQQRMTEDEATFREFAQAERDYAYPLLERYAGAALGELNVQDSLLKRQSAFNAWLQNVQQKQQAQQKKASDQLMLHIAAFRSRWPERCLDLGTTAEGAQDYVALLTQLRRDDLPRFAGRFREMLKENTINQIALFHTHLDSCCRNIEERIGLINDSLAEIDYNAGRFIQIEYIPTSNETVRQFRNDLRLCTENVLTGDDAAYSEQKFRQVAAIVERLEGRPEHTESDAKWRQLVTDVRNWYTFAASERWRETGEEYEHYTDSGGKSGGQKEKLAYTILAASIVYNFGIEGRQAGERSFRFVVIDEAFLKSSDESARFGLELFKKLDLQLLVVTPLLKLATIEPFVQHVGFVYLKDAEHRSYMRNLTIKEFRADKAAAQLKGGEARG